MKENIVLEAFVECAGVPLGAAEVRVQELGGTVTNLRFTKPSNTQARGNGHARANTQEYGMMVTGRRRRGPDARSERLGCDHRR